MTEKKKSRVEVENLPEPEEELSAEDAKKVGGGHWGHFEVERVKADDGSVRPQDSPLIKPGT